MVLDRLYGARRRTEGGTAWAARQSAVPEGYTAATPWIISRDTAGLLDFVQEAFDAVELARLDRVGRVRDSLGKLWWIQARVESVDEAETVRRLGDPEWAARMEYVQGSPRIP